MSVQLVRRGSPLPRGERGVTLIVFAIVATALFIITALVIDLGFVRQNRQSDKNVADFAAAAGVRGLDNGAGRSQPWKGICTARDYVLANKPEYAGMVGAYWRGDGTAISTDPCLSKSEMPYTTLCTTDPSTWGVFEGKVNGGRAIIRILSGYIPDGTPAFAGSDSFTIPEDTSAYVGDPGKGPCTHLAVIVDEREGAKFGAIAGSAGHDTRIRSVGRLTVGSAGGDAAALVVLERHDCDAIRASGSGTRVIVNGNESRPGLIHVDSLGNGSGCGGLFRTDGSSPVPPIFAGRATEENDEGDIAPGLITATALVGPPGVASTARPPVTEVCAQVEEDDCVGSGGGDQPKPRPLVSRSVVDERYRVKMRELRNLARDYFTAGVAPAGYTPRPCNLTEYSDSKVFISGCPGGGIGSFRAGGKTFTSAVREVFINANVDWIGGPGTLRFHSPEKIFIRGSVSLGNNNNLLVNTAALTPPYGSVPVGFELCPGRGDPAALTQMVIGSTFSATGGDIRMCQTTVLLDAPGAACDVPTTDGTAPMVNSCNGVFGNNGAVIEWTAPNQDATGTLEGAALRAVLDKFEDLALWSESGSGATAWSMGGNANSVRLKGVYFTPNANPVSIGGSGSWYISDAQFFTRKLLVSGGGVLEMAPNYVDVVPIPSNDGFGLVR